MTTFAEAAVEQTAPARLAGFGWNVARSPDIASDAPGAGRGYYGKVVLMPQRENA